MKKEVFSRRTFIGAGMTGLISLLDSPSFAYPSDDGQLFYLRKGMNHKLIEEYTQRL